MHAGTSPILKSAPSHRQKCPRPIKAPALACACKLVYARATSQMSAQVRACSRKFTHACKLAHARKLAHACAISCMLTKASVCAHKFALVRICAKE